MNLNKSDILILVDKKAKFNSQFNLASSLSKEFKVSFLITVNKKIELVDIKDAKNRVRSIFNEHLQPKKTNFLIKFFKSIFKRNILFSLFYIIDIYLKRIRVEGIITRLEPKIFILNGDRSGPSFETVFLLIAKKKNIKVIIPYLSIVNSGIKVRLQNKSLYKISFFGKLIYGKKANFKFNSGNQDYGFYSLPQYIALTFLKTLTENPFSLGNNKITDVLCLDSNFTFNFLKGQIIFPQKVKIIGRPEYDFLSKNLDLNRSITLLSLPQLYEHKILDWETHIIFIKKIVKILSKNTKLTINLHPKCLFQDYKFLELEFDCEISKNKIEEDLIIAKSFICVNSSIAIWALLLGVKTIILDYFKLDMTMFSGIESLIYVKSEKELELELNKSGKIDFSKDWTSLGRDNLFQTNSIDNYNSLINKFLI